MPKPYDAATKRLIELRPADWAAFLGLPLGPVSLVDADLSTVSTFADRLIRVDAPVPYLMHNELESGKDNTDVPTRLFHYNASAYFKLRLPVVSSVFLLRREGNSPQLDGVFSLLGPDGNDYVTFRYNVVRVWQIDAEQLLTGGIGTLPLAPIAQVTPDGLPRLIERMDGRIEAEAVNANEAAELWTVTNVLMGLRYNKVFRNQLLQKVRRMRESNTYQEILDEGRIEGRIEGAMNEARRLVLRVGARRLGAVTVANEARVQAIASLTTLELLLDRVPNVETWDDLLRDLP